MLDTSKHKKTTRNSRELIEQLAKELCGERGLASLVTMLGVNEFFPLNACPGVHHGGFAFHYDSNLVSNKSNIARIVANTDGTRTFQWLCLNRSTMEIKEVDKAEGVAPSQMEHVWLEHTRCEVRIPWVVVAAAHRVNVRLGKIYCTRGARDTFSDAELLDCFRRHKRGDWGDICKSDKKVNDEGLDVTMPGRLLSAYKYEDGRVLWVFTETDRSKTTALLPDEY